jgi:SnoaL-like domain
MPARDAVQLLVDREAVHDVMFRYADGVDRRDMEQVRSCFAPDLRVVGWGGGFPDREAMITYISGVAIFHTTMHMFGNDYIDIHGDTAHLDCYAMLTHHLDDTRGGSSEMNVSGGRYVESLERRGDQWVITQRGGDPHWSSSSVTDISNTDDPATQWLLDRAEIHDLMMQYALGIDLRDYDRVARCFASSFHAQYGDREFTDTDALIAFVSGVEHFASTTHFLGSQLIEVDGDEAWMHTYSLVTHRPDDADASGHWFAAGRYLDHLIREDGHWRIAHRGPLAHDGRPARRAAPKSDDARVRGLLDRAAVHDAIVDSAIARDAHGDTRHLVNNLLVDIEGDEATAQTYVYATEQGTDGRPSPWSQGARRWIDRLRRVDDEWQVVDRVDETTRVPDELMISADEAAARARTRATNR